MSTVAALFRYPLGDDAVLLPRTPELAEAYHEVTVANLERLGRWNPPASEPPTLEQTRGRIEAQVRGWLEGTVLPVAIAVPADGGWRLAGGAELHINRPLRSGEIGYWIDAAHEGRGLVTRTVAALIDAAFGQYGLDRVAIGTVVGNHRSRAIPERLGFTREGVLRAAIPVGGGERHDEILYGLLATDWKDRRPAG